MASPLKCDLCSNQATVHLTQIVNHKVHKVDLCESCAQAKGVTDPSGFSLADLLLKASLNPEPTAVPSGGKVCAKCGYGPEDFKKTGRFGCPDCYDVFAALLEPMLDNMHKGTAHTGKIPERAMVRKTLHDRLSKLETELQSAIQSERYEDAAKFRDEIVQVRHEAGIKEVV